MKYALLLASASSVLADIVFETQYNTFYVTVDGFGNTVPAATGEPVTVTSLLLPSKVPSKSLSIKPASHLASTAPANILAAPAVGQFFYTSEIVIPPAEPTTTSQAPAPAPTTSSETPEPVTTTSEAPAPVTTSSSTSSQPTQTGSGSSGLTGLAQQIVDYHNKVRSEHGVGSLQWSDDLASYAQNYLNGDNCVFKHSGGPYGENIALGYGTPDEAQDAWYDEYKDYNYAAAQFSSSTGHFTQMVWKGTTTVGCAISQCGDGPFLVCEYEPRGNIIGEFAENVFQ